MLNEGQDDVLMRPTIRALGLAFKATDESLVYFDRPAITTHRGHQATSAHGFTNAMGEEPSRLVCDAQGPMKLMGANALL